MSDGDSTSLPAETTSSAPEPTPAESPPSPIETLSEPQTAQIPASEPLPTTNESVPTGTPVATQISTNPSIARDLLAKARAMIQSRKQKKLEKILEFLSTKAKITNDEVEKLLHVSDATATRYLEILEKQGKVKQVGKTGKTVEYTRI